MFDKYEKCDRRTDGRTVRHCRLISSYSELKRRGEEGLGGTANVKSPKNVFNWTISIVVIKIEYLYNSEV